MGELKLTLDAQDDYGDFEVRYMNHQASMVPLTIVPIKIHPKEGACLHDTIHAQPYRQVYKGPSSDGDDFFFTLYTCQKCDKKWTDPLTTVPNTSNWTGGSLNGHIKCVFE